MSYSLYACGTKAGGRICESRRETDAMHITYMGSREGREGSEEGGGSGGRRIEGEGARKRARGGREGGRQRGYVWLRVCACECVSARCFSAWMDGTAPAYTFLRNLPNSLERHRQRL